MKLNDINNGLLKNMNRTHLPNSKGQEQQRAFMIYLSDKISTITKILTLQWKYT